MEQAAETCPNGYDIINNNSDSTVMTVGQQVMPIVHRQLYFLCR